MIGSERDGVLERLVFLTWSANTSDPSGSD